VLWLTRLVAAFPPWRPGFDHRSGHVGFVVGKVALGQVSSESFGFLCQFSFHRLFHTHHLSSGVGTIGQIMADVRSGLSLTPPNDIINVTFWLETPSPPRYLGVCGKILRLILRELRCEVDDINDLEDFITLTSSVCNQPSPGTAMKPQLEH
jgi:hypothetical protein